jgi:hypothetical protein
MFLVRFPGLQLPHGKGGDRGSPLHPGLTRHEMNLASQCLRRETECQCQCPGPVILGDRLPLCEGPLIRQLQ